VHCNRALHCSPSTIDYSHEIAQLRAFGFAEALLLAIALPHFIRSLRGWCLVATGVAV
jgi:hypothetical protein